MFLRRSSILGENSVQFFNWGNIEWIYEADSIGSLNVMNIGIVTIESGKRQNKHVHYGDEQLIYVISGKGRQQLGDELHTIRAGSIHHIEAGSIHETMNMEKEPIVELIISIPVVQKKDFSIYKMGKIISDYETLEDKAVSDAIYKDEIQELYESAMESLEIPMSVFNKDGKTVIEGENYPELCKIACRVHEDNGNCRIYQIHDEYAPPIYNDSSAYVCPFGLTVLVVPIVIRQTVIGWIKGGHIRTFRNEFSSNEKNVPHGDYNMELFENMPVLPKSRVNAILKIIKEMGKSFAEYNVLKNTKTELNKKERMLREIAQNESMLEESLKLVQDEMLNIQINNHFLFNTLNAIASLAVQENSMKTYDSVIDLSNMFRYSLRNNSNKILLKEEVDYLKNYIALQQLRYGDNLEVDFEIPEKLEKVCIPFNCLQQIVGNCFKHGFKDMKGRIRIVIHAESDEREIRIAIEDNGMGMESEELYELVERLRDGSGRNSGLMMTTSKLKSFYGDAFSIEIDSRPEGGTRVTLSLPQIVY
jgi:uncharacterized RmlC-like cupin family protein/ligand-binding sensor protein